MAKQSAAAPAYIARVGITSDIRGLRIEPGEVVPPAVLEDAPWLIEQGAAVLEGGATAQEPETGAQIDAPSLAILEEPAPAVEAPSEPSGEVAQDEPPSEPLEAVEGLEVPPAVEDPAPVEEA